MRFIVTVLILSLICIGGAFAQHFEPVPENGVRYSIVIDHATINGVSLTDNDEIAVFDGDLCVGVVIVDGNIFPEERINISATQSVNQDGIVLPGYTAGNQIYFKIYDASADFELYADEYIMPEDVEFITGNGNFGFGMYSLVGIDTEIEGLAIEGILTQCTAEGNPIEGAEVWFNDEHVTTTDANGMYSLADCQMGANEVTFIHPEYYDNTINVNITEMGEPTNGDAVMYYSDLQVNDEMPVVFEVLGDLQGEASIQVEGIGCADNYEYTASLVDPDQDWVSINILQGVVPVGLTRNIGIEVDLNGLDPENNQEFTIQIRLASEHRTNDVILEFTVICNIEDTLTGQVLECTDDGPPIEGVGVCFNDEEDPRGFTDANGEFEITNAPTGLNRVRFEDQRYNFINRNNVEVPGDMGVILLRGPHPTVEDNLELTIPISGVDTTGSATFTLDNTGCATMYFEAGPTNPADEWITCDPEIGEIIGGRNRTVTVNVDLMDPSYTGEIIDGATIDAEITIIPQEDHTQFEPIVIPLNIELTLSAGIEVVVTECTEDGPVISGVHVFVNDEEADTTDENGEIELDVAQGAVYNLRFEHGSYYPVTEPGVRAPNVIHIVMMKPDAVLPTETQEITVDGIDYEGSVQFDMVGAGCANLNWSTSVVGEGDQDWISVDPSQGMIRPEETRTITVTADMTGLNADTLEHGEQFPIEVHFFGEHWNGGEHTIVNVLVTVMNEGSLEGTVWSCEENGTPLEGVGVYLNNDEEPVAVTDANGEYSTTDVSMGATYNISFRHPYYYPRQRTNVQVPGDAPAVANMVLYNPAAVLDYYWVHIPVQFDYFACDSTGSATFTITHDGCADLEWSAAFVDDTIDYITLEPSSGELEVGETETITVNVDLRGDPPPFPLVDMEVHNFEVQFSGDYWYNPPTMVLAVQPRLGVGDIEGQMPTEYTLGQNYPNPFNPVTEISYTLVEQQNVTLSVFNLMGQEVARLVDGTVAAGYHNVSFDASNMTTGVYFYRINTPAFKETKKMLFVK